MTIDLTQRWQVLNADCLDVLRELPDGCADLILTDPPFFRVKDEEWDRQWSSEESFLEWLGSVLIACKRVLAPNGSIFVFTSAEMNTRIEVMMRRWFDVLNNIRWIKDAGWHKKAERASLRQWLTPWEGIVFAGQRGDQYAEAERSLHKAVYAPIGRAVQRKRETAGLQRWQVDEACSPSKKPTGLCYRWEEGACLPTEEQYAALCRLVGDRREYEQLRREYEQLRREYEQLRRPFTLADSDDASDCWHFQTVPPKPDKHPCEKPVRMLKHMIEATTRPGARVLDPFCGSGSTGVACAQTGRKFVGIEKDQEWATASQRRIGEAANTLWTPPAPREPEPTLNQTPAL